MLATALVDEKLKGLYSAIKELGLKKAAYPLNARAVILERINSMGYGAIWDSEISSDGNNFGETLEVGKDKLIVPRLSKEGKDKLLEVIKDHVKKANSELNSIDDLINLKSEEKKKLVEEIADDARIHAFYRDSDYKNLHVYFVLGNGAVHRACFEFVGQDRYEIRPVFKASQAGIEPMPYLNYDSFCGDVGEQLKNIADHSKASIYLFRTASFVVNPDDLLVHALPRVSRLKREKDLMEGPTKKREEAVFKFKGTEEADPRLVT